MSNTTYSVKKKEIVRKWYIIDAENKPIGRVSAEAAKLLKGKHKPIYSTHLDTGDHVIIINASKAILTGKKMTQKIYRRHTGYIGNMKEVMAKDLMATKPERAFMLAVKGMLPKNSLGRSMIKKLRVYKDAEHNHQAQAPEIWNF
ncbi:MAG: 50S ribosomal protein L13 [Clostridiales bacterium]|nr:50S ribosomal protein L13 [Clostridiales bacterium]